MKEIYATKLRKARIFSKTKYISLMREDVITNVLYATKLLVKI